MLNKRTLCFGLLLFGFVVGSFLGGRAGAQQLGQLSQTQSLPRERTAAYTFPRAWGELKTVTATARGFTYVFVADNGAIRVVQSSPVGPEDIEVISR
jgi:hypothetical protein